MTLEEIVANSIRDHRPAERAEAQAIGRFSSLAEGIRRAALCYGFPEGKRQAHPRRIRAAALEGAERRLQGASVGQVGQKLLASRRSTPRPRSPGEAN